jgi:hypothetical protein
MKVRFLKQYTANSSGNVFRDYETEDGRLITVRTRVGRDGIQLFTNAEAKAEAIRRAQKD